MANDFFLICGPFRGDFIIGAWKTQCPWVTNDYLWMNPLSLAANAEQ